MTSTDPPAATSEQVLRRFVLGWAAAGGVALVLVVFVVGVHGPRVDPLTFVLVCLGATLVMSLPLELHVAGRRFSFDLTEAAIVVGASVLPLRGLLPAVLIGSAASLLLRRVDGQKLAFNLGVNASAVGVVVVVLALAGLEPPDVTRGDHLLVLLAAMLGYVAVTLAATVGLWRRLAGRIAGGIRPLLATTLLGSGIGTGLALLVIGTAVAVPVLLPVLVGMVVLTGWSLRQQVGHLGADLEAHARLERVVAGASDGIGLLDPRGRIELANPALRRLFQLEAIPHGQRLTDILAALPDASGRMRVEAAERLGRRLAELAPDQAFSRVEIDLGAQVLAIELTGTFDTVGQQTGVVVLAFDVTAAREAEAVRADLVARVSHELRTPLTSIVGFVETLEHQPALGEDERAHYLAIVGRQARRLQRLVGTLLWSARIDAGLTARTRPETIALRRLVEETLGALPPAPSGVAESVDIPDGVAAYADPDHLTQILENLVLNARTYGEAPIRVGAAPEGDEVVVEVSDAGAGVSPAFEAAMFRPFQQASSGDRRTATGLGLGLSIVHALAEVNRGQVRFVRRQGRSCFEVRLPRQPTARSGSR